MGRKKKIILSIIGVLLLAAAIVGMIVSNLKKAGLPDYNQDIKLAGLSAPVTVIRDGRGVPHITAQTEKDLYQVMGYLMSQDRIWQMDLLRRVTMGKLSEIFGPSMVEADLLFRSLAISEKSKDLVKTCDPEVIESLVYFTKGVNQYLADNKENLPFEFRVLGYEPGPWEVFHSLNLIGYMAWDLSSAWKSEVLLQRIGEKVGDELLQELVPDFSDDTPVYPLYQGSRALIDNLEKVMAAQADIRKGMGLIPLSASNNWAVSGEKSVTGKPLLANDMHLSLFIPGIWYQAHQTVPGKLNVTGVVLPGQPSVICGHNEDIAWGMTNVMSDDLDFFLERTDPARPGQYLYKGRWKPFKRVKETIRVKGEEPVIKEILFTHRGPVVSQLKKEKKHVISMQWMGNAQSNEMRTVYLLNRAGNWDEFREALKTFISISQNVVYADVKGNIGLVNTGGIPVRARGNGTRVVPGWTGEYEWEGIVPFGEKPFLFNPPSGFVASANNRTVSQDFPYPISPWGFATSHRIDRINTLLSSKEKFSLDDFKAFQMDVVSSFSKEIEPSVTALEENKSRLAEKERLALEILKNWDGKADADSLGVTIANAFFLSLMEIMVKDEMGEEYFREFFKIKVLTQQFFKQVVQNPENPWFDRVGTGDKKERYQDAMVMAFKQSVVFLEEKLGTDPNEWRWGRIHTLTLAHPLGKVDLLDKVLNLNRGPYPMPGSYHTVLQLAYHHDRAFEISLGPSQRHIFPIGDWDKSRTVIPTGVSGIPASPYYCNQTGKYVKGEYRGDPFSREAVEKSGKYKAVFSPL